MSASSNSNTPPDGYFNDLSQPTGNQGNDRGLHSPNSNMNNGANAASGDATKPVKRIACIICRKRKLKCDGSKPSCSTCTRLGHDCAYDEVRRKSGPKRGYVKALEERLKQVETLLKTQDPTTTNTGSDGTKSATESNGAGLGSAADFTAPSASINIIGINGERWGIRGDSPQQQQQPLDDLAFTADMDMGMGLEDSTFTWEMIGLGLEEPLPPQDTVDELYVMLRPKLEEASAYKQIRHQIYFDKIHPSLPMIHKYRYLAAMNLAPNQRPPVTLRYAMWTLAASVTDKYMDLRDHFYQRARKYMEFDYVKGHGEHMISVAHAQTHILLASFEFKMMYFPRAWMSTGSAIRLCQMMSLNRLDGAGLDVKQCLPPPRDWTEREERRRTFWMAFCEDRYASIGTGWPMSIDEKDILTDLPASDHAFENNKPERTGSLTDSLTPSGASKLSSFGGIVLMACLFGRNLIHLHRPDEDDRDDDLNGAFWKRHRNMDNILLNTSLSMPGHFRLPTGLGEPNIVFTNMNIHTSTICLHQAAIYKAEKNRLPASVSAESKIRCISAANETANIMRMISHMDLSAMNPFISFCLYVAARVFIQYLKSRPEDSQTADSLRFILSAMNALKRKNPLTESFLVQLDVDLEGLGMRNPKYKAVFAYSEDNLGISSSNAPMLGKCTASVSPAIAVNECNFLPAGEVSYLDVEKSTRASGSDAAEFRRPSDPVSSTTSLPLREGFASPEQGWLPLPHHRPAEETQDPQRILQSVAVGVPSYDAGQRFSMSEHSSNAESRPSPDTSGSSRPTPGSSDPSDTRSKGNSGQSNSGGGSFESSPAASSSRLPEQHRTLNAFFSMQADYSGIMSTGLTPENRSSLPETPGRNFEVPSGWEMSNSQTTGLTPVGEGVFRELMGMTPMDSMAMDLGWEGGQ